MGPHLVALPFGKTDVEGYVDDGVSQRFQATHLRLGKPWPLANIAAHDGLHHIHDHFLFGLTVSRQKTGGPYFSKK